MKVEARITMRKKIRAAYALAHEAERKRDRTIEQIIKPGSVVDHDKGGNRVSVVVMSVSGDRLKVFNQRTGKEYHIDAYHVV